MTFQMLKPTIIAFTLLLVFLVSTDPDPKSNMAVYAAAFFIVIVTYTLMSKKQGSEKKHSGKRRKLDDTIAKIDSREKKLMIFYLLDLVDKKDSVDMNDIAANFEFSIYELTNIIRFLNKHEVLTVIYPPMRNFPILRRGDHAKSRKFRLAIFKQMAKKKITGEPKIEDFSREVEEYLQNMRRKNG
jgi:hypothetical protein